MRWLIKKGLARCVTKVAYSATKHKIILSWSYIVFLSGLTEPRISAFEMKEISGGMSNNVHKRILLLRRLTYVPDIILVIHTNHHIYTERHTYMGKHIVQLYDLLRKLSGRYKILFFLFLNVILLYIWHIKKLLTTNK